MCESRANGVMYNTDPLAWSVVGARMMPGHIGRKKNNGKRNASDNHHDMVFYVECLAQANCPVAKL